ncbi:MAG: DUF4124 domain-containing protein, partial [Halioglobus sp.]
MRSVLQPCIGAAAALLLAVSSLPASSETYYRWVNERGYPVHSDRPPPAGTEYEVVSTGSKLKRQVEAQEGAVPPEVEPRVGNEFEPVNTAKQPAVMEKNPEYCKRARANLEALNNFARITVTDDNGDIRFLNDEERAAQKA